MDAQRVVGAEERGAGARVRGRREYAVWAVTAAACLASLARALFVRPTVFEAFDFVQLHAIYRQYARRALLAGRVPLWNPHVNLGRPFLADIETANWYPPNLLFWPLPLEPALAIVLALHLALALVGVLRLGRYLGMQPAAAALAGTAFAIGNIPASRLVAGHVHFVEGMAYLPLLLLLTARLQDRFSGRRLAALAVALVLQLLTGHPQIAWVTWFGLATFLFGRRLPASPSDLGRLLLLDAGRFAAALAMAFALGAVQLLPFAEMVSVSNRAAHTLEFASLGALTPRDALSLLVPPGRGYRVYWESNLYAGSLTVLAGVAGMVLVKDRNIRALTLGAVVAGLLSLGQLTPVFDIAYWIVPGISTFHIHSRLAIWTTFAVCIAAGAFLSQSGAAWPARGLLSRLAPPAGLAVAGLLALRPLLPRAGWRALLGLAAGLALLILWRRAPTPAVRAVVSLALAVDLLAASLELTRTYEGAPDYPGEAVATAMLREAGMLGEGVPPPRTSLPFSFARPNAGMLQGFSTYTGYAGLSPERVWNYVHRQLDLTPPLAIGTYPSSLINWRGAFPYDSMALVLGWDPATGGLRLRTNPDPRAFLAFRTERVADWREAIERLRLGHDTAVALVEDAELELEPHAGAQAPAAEGSVQVVDFRPEEVRLRVDSPYRAVLVIKEAWYPAWTASVDGEPTSCRPANAWARGVIVPPGAHDVRLRYRPTWIVVGGLVSVLAAAGLAVLCRWAPES